MPRLTDGKGKDCFVYETISTNLKMRQRWVHVARTFMTKIYTTDVTVTGVAEIAEPILKCGG